MLGLCRLGATALAYERGVETDCEDTPALTAALIADIEQSITAMSKLAEVAMAET